MNGRGNDPVDTLKKQIASGKVAPLYIFYGPESYLLEHYMRELKKKLLPEGLEEFNLDRLDGAATVTDIRQAVECVPMMCGKRLVIVTDYDLYKQSPESRERLEELLRDIPDSCCLVFAYDVLDYKPDKRQKLAGVISDIGLEVQFALQDERQLVRWIRRRLNAQGKGITDTDAQYMLFLCGAQMHLLGQETEKLIAYARDEYITRSDIDAVVVPVLEARVFAMCAALAEGKTAKAAAVLMDLAALREEPVAILGAVSWQIRGMYAARLIIERKLGTKEYMALTGGRSQYQAGEMLRVSKRRSLDWCRDAVLACLDTDRLLKGLSRNRERELELLLARLSG